MALRTPSLAALVDSACSRSFRRTFTCLRKLQDGERAGSNFQPSRSSSSRPPPSRFQQSTSFANKGSLKIVDHLATIQKQSKATKRRLTPESIEASTRSTALQKLQTRRWKAGDVYAPHDLSSAEMQKWRRKGKPTRDAFDALNLNPLNEYKNFSVLGEYMTDMGRIKHSSETGLRSVNQRRIAKAIRRSIGMGLMPSVHKHPEILYIEQNQRNARGQFY
ncbi:MAG: hypothetical protein M1830_007383 [Pleopsidium flavum]|nr:MAG: hypothetical protein M1830_007383 [Pleopsidium flavum]